MFKPIKLTRLNYRPIRVHFNLDLDRDSVRDFADCQPFNPYAQEELVEEIKEKLTGGVEAVKRKIAERKHKKLAQKATRQVEASVDIEYGKYQYLYAKVYYKTRQTKEEIKKEHLDRAKWVKLGKIPVDIDNLSAVINNMISEFKNKYPEADIIETHLSTNPNQLRELNRGALKEYSKERLGEIKKGTEKYLAERKFGENIKSGLRMKSQPYRGFGPYRPFGKTRKSPFKGFPGERKILQPSFGMDRESIERRVLSGGPVSIPTDEETYSPDTDYDLETGYELPSRMPAKRYGYLSNRSPNFQESSKFSRQVVPYRPISREQISLSKEDIMTPYKPVKALYQNQPPTPLYSSQHRARPPTEPSTISPETRRQLPLAPSHFNQPYPSSRPQGVMGMANFRRAYFPSIKFPLMKLGIRR